MLVVGRQGVVRVGQDIVGDVDVAGVQLLRLRHGVQHVGGGVGVVIHQADLLGVNIAKPSRKCEGRKSRKVVLPDDDHIRKGHKVLIIRDSARIQDDQITCVEAFDVAGNGFVIRFVC